MKLETTRLLLREVEKTDLNMVHELLSFPEVDRYNTLGLPADMDTTKGYVYDWITAQQVNPRAKYVLYLETTTHEFVGLAGINIGKPNYRQAEFWYKLHPEQWNKGYATEVVQALLAFCFNDLNLHRITAGCAVKNTASIKVLEKCGFLKEAHHRKILPIRGEWVDNYEFAILEEEYFKDTEPK
jgi:RimJ/RimL family protein N-acetyltransferase